MTLQEFIDQNNTKNTGLFYNGFVGVEAINYDGEGLGNSDLAQFDFPASDLETTIQVVGNWQDDGEVMVHLPETLYRFYNTRY